jgi:Epoxide hydrolase N terminus
MLDPFTIAVADAELEDLRRRLDRTRPISWPDDAGWDDGTDPAWLEGLLAYWRDGYEWRAQEEALNRLTHYRTTVDGTGFTLSSRRGLAPIRCR